MLVIGEMIPFGIISLNRKDNERSIDCKRCASAQPKKY